MKLRTIPKRRLSDMEKEIILLRTELSKVRRDKADMILNKGVMMYFGFLIIAVVGLLNGYVNFQSLEVIVILGILAILLPVWVYTDTMAKEERELEDMIEDLYH